MPRGLKHSLQEMHSDEVRVLEIEGGPSRLGPEFGLRGLVSAKTGSKKPQG